MRVLIAHDSAHAAGGVESYLATIVRELAARGHDLRTLHQSAAAQKPHWAPGLPSSCVEQLGLDRAVEGLRRWQPEVCYSHNMGALATERRLLDEWPVVKMMHGYFGTCISGQKTHALPTTSACCRTFGPACLPIYVARRCGGLSVPAVIGGYRWSVRQRALFQRYRAIVVASEHMRREYERHGAEGARLHVLPLFSTLDSVDPRAPCGSAVLFAGRMTPLKGGQVLVAALAHAAKRLGRPVPLLLAGDGPQRESWQRLAQAAGVPALSTGWLGPDARGTVYSQAALLALPSLWPEPFGLVGLEAASLGIPAVAFDVGGVREWLEPERSGVLVAPEDGSVGLGAAIAALMADPGRLRALGDGARRVAARLSPGAHVDRLEHVLGEAVKSPHPGTSQASVIPERTC